MNISLKAKSSSGSFYSVDFIKVEEGLSVHCECPAGEWGKFCKHKWQLLNGDEAMLFDSAQLSELQTINSIALERGVNQLYEGVESLEVLKKSLTKEQQKEKSSVKKSLANRILLTEEKFIAANAKLHEIDKKLAFTSYLISKEKEVIEKKLKNGF
jgi:hypothetical protein